MSLIAGMEYGMEWWNGKWNGTMNVSWALISPQRLYEQVQCMLPPFFLVQFHDVTVRAQTRDQLQYHA